MGIFLPRSYWRKRRHVYHGLHFLILVQYDWLLNGVPPLLRLAAVPPLLFALKLRRRWQMGSDRTWREHLLFSAVRPNVHCIVGKRQRILPCWRHLDFALTSIGMRRFLDRHRARISSPTTCDAVEPFEAVPDRSRLAPCSILYKTSVLPIVQLSCGNFPH